MSAAAPSRGLVGLLKRGWNEIPEVIGSGFMSLIGIGLGAYGLWHYYSIDGDNRKYRDSYTVIRHDDPRAAKVHKP